jgi:ADP-heptose:LPS heptosyltransferase
MKILLIELWGLGDAVLMTTVLRPLLAAGFSVTLLCKPATAELLQPTYPALDFLTFDAPWTAFRGKYRFWTWPWRRLFQIVRTLRREHFSAAASVRNDPRDHLLMFLSGVRRRLGYPRLGSGLLLTQRLVPSSTKSHRVDLWRQIAAAILEENAKSLAASLMPAAVPFLDAAAYGHARLDIASENSRPIVGLHCGARIAVRRWKEESFARTLRLLRGEADFHLALFPDPDGYGRALLPLADSCHEGLSIPELAASLAACDLVICNDSGPGHIAAALGRPVLAIFGPQEPAWFRPYGENNHVVIRDICPFRPCFDYCHFPEPICLTRLDPDEVWPEVRAWFHQHFKKAGTRTP